MRNVFLAACVGLLLAGFTLSTSTAAELDNAKAKKVEAEIAKVNADWDKAYMSCDIEAAKRIMAEDYVSVWGDGSVKTRDKELADLKSGAYKLISMQYHEPLKVRCFGNTAVAVTRATPNELFDGKPAENPAGTTFRIMTTWVKESGRWQVVAMAATMIPPK